MRTPITPPDGWPSPSRTARLRFLRSMANVAVPRLTLEPNPLRKGWASGPAAPLGAATVTVSQMREVDRLMVEVAGVSMLQMMENAGRGLAQVVRHQLGGDLRGSRVLVLAGAGGNGGGGLVAARRMAGWGARVDVVLTISAADLNEILALQARALALTGVRLLSWPDPAAESSDRAAIDDAIAEADIVVDAVIGYGLAGPPRGAAKGLIELANSTRAPVVALDVPSGLNADTGQPADPTVRAAATVTLALPKPGLLVAEGPAYVGDLYLADIGVPVEVYRRVGVDIGAIFANADVVRVA